MLFENKKEPEIQIINGKEKYGWIESKIDYNKEYHKNNIKSYEVCKIQDINDLKPINRILDELRYEKDFVCYGLGNKCYLFSENDEVKIKTMKDHINSKTFDTKLGLITCINSGEFGGSLIITDLKGELSVFDSFMNSPDYIFEYEDKVYIIASLSHLGGSEFSLHELRKCGDKFEIITLFKSDDLDFAGYYMEDNFIYFYSNSRNDGLYRIDILNAQLELIKKNICNMIVVNSLLKQDNFIYIYGNYTLVKFNLKTGEIDSIYTNLEYSQINEFWLIDDDVKLLDVWDDLDVE